MIIHIGDCIANKKYSQLVVSYSKVGKYPPEITVRGKKKSVRFVPVPYGHSLFDEDGWDGEQSVYIPTSKSGWVKSLVVSFGM